MEGVQRRPIYDGRLVTNEHLSAVIERIDDDGSRVAKPNLEDGLLVLLPPAFADRCVVITELQQVADDRPSSWDLGNALDVWDVCCSGPLSNHKQQRLDC